MSSSSSSARSATHPKSVISATARAVTNNVDEFTSQDVHFVEYAFPLFANLQRQQQRRLIGNFLRGAEKKHAIISTVEMIDAHHPLIGAIKQPTDCNQRSRLSLAQSAILKHPHQSTNPRNVAFQTSQRKSLVAIIFFRLVDRSLFMEIASINSINFHLMHINRKCHAHPQHYITPPPLNLR